MTYSPKLSLWKHQMEALDRMDGREYFALLMSMRTGKTATALADFGRLWSEGKVDDLLVIAPAGVYRTWEKAILDHVGDPLDELLRIAVWSAGQMESKVSKARWEAFLTPSIDGALGGSSPRCLLVNVEALSKTKKARDLVMRFLSQNRVYAVCDESTSIKSYKSKRGRFMVENVERLAKYRRILTGLVAPKDPSDVFNQYEFLKRGCLGFSNFYAFQARYAIMAKAFGRGRNPGESQQFIKVVGWRDQDELKLRIDRCSFRVRLSDCYDLPPKLYQIREVELTDEQERVYRELKTYSTTMLSNSVHVTALQACTVALRLHQIVCGHVGDENGVRRSVSSNRVAALLELLEEYEDGKAIIWCAYDADVRAVSRALDEAYGSRSFSRFWGGNRETRENEERTFLSDPACRFMVATASAGGRGRTWVEADLVIYFSNTQDLEHREQSEERAQGVDKIKSVLYVDLVAKHRDGSGTIDETYLHALRSKISMAALLMGDGWRRWVV